MKNNVHLIPKAFFYKNGSKIHIKKQNKGKFTDYCGGKVTEECIQKGLHSPNATIRKRANFARNARKWKHQQGGTMQNYFNFLGAQNDFIQQNVEASRDKQKRAKEFHDQQVQNTANTVKNIGGMITGLASMAGSAFSNKKGSFTNGPNSPKTSDIQKPPIDDTVGVVGSKNTSKNMFNIDTSFKGLMTPEAAKNQMNFNLGKQVIKPQLSTTLSKKGSKLIHKTHGWTSVLDDTGVVSRKTLKLK